MDSTLSGIEAVNAAYDDFNEAIEKALVDNTEELSLELFSRITFKTPVDTGRARAAWNLSANKISDRIPLEHEKIKLKSGKGHRTTYGIPKPKDLHLAPYSIVYITNNLPYILKLEDGSSDQTPNGMVALSVEEVLREAQNGI